MKVGNLLQILDEIILNRFKSGQFNEDIEAYFKTYIEMGLKKQFRIIEEIISVRGCSYYSLPSEKTISLLTDSFNTIFKSILELEDSSPLKKFFLYNLLLRTWEGSKVKALPIKDRLELGGMPLSEVEIPLVPFQGLLNKLNIKEDNRVDIQGIKSQLIQEYEVDFEKGKEDSYFSIYKYTQRIHMSFQYDIEAMFLTVGDTNNFMNRDPKTVYSEVRLLAKLFQYEHLERSVRTLRAKNKIPAYYFYRECRTKTLDLFQNYKFELKVNTFDENMETPTQKIVEQVLLGDKRPRGVIVYQRNLFEVGFGEFSEEEMPLYRQVMLEHKCHVLIAIGTSKKREEFILSKIVYQQEF